MNLEKKLVLLAFLIAIARGNAQTLNDPFYFNFTILPESGYKNGSGEFQSDFWELNVATPPVKIGKSLNWVNNIYYRSTSISFHEPGSNEHQYPSRLNDIRYSSVFRFQLNNKVELVAIPRLMIRSDLRQSLTEKDLFAQAVFLGAYAINGNPNFKIGLGLALNNDFERNAIIPIGSLYYDSKKFRAEVIYPNANLLYKYSEKFEFGLFASVDGAISRIQPFVQDGHLVNYFRNFQLLIAPTVSSQLYKNIYAHLKVGVAPIRYYEKLNNDFNAIKNMRYDLDGSFFLRAGLSYRIKN